MYIDSTPVVLGVVSGSVDSVPPPYHGGGPLRRNMTPGLPEQLMHRGFHEGTLRFSALLLET